MAILFVPLTTLALQDLQGPDIGQGSGLNNMMRQLGGSFGIAILTTLIHTRSGQVRNALVEYVNPYNPAYQQRNTSAIQSFMSKGYSVFDARQMADRAIEGTVVKQTLLLTYDNLYLIIGLFTLACIPIVYLQKFKKNAAMPADAH
jgi:DHA2 family multidrug resistance protein